MNPHHIEKVKRCIKTVRTSVASTLLHLDELDDAIDQLVGAYGTVILQPPSRSPVQLDRPTYSVRWRDKSCFLGCTMAYRVLERLAQRPGEFVSTERLLEELWEATRTTSTVRSTIWGLKCKLRAAGLEELADMIDGSNPGHYRLRAASR